MAFPTLRGRERRSLVLASYRNLVRAALGTWGGVLLPPAAADGVHVTARLGAWPLLGEEVPCADGEGEGDGLRVPFLGLEALAPAGFAREALSTGRALRVVLALPEGDDGRRWAAWASPDLAADVRELPPEAAVAEATARVQAVLERVIRARPDLWVWSRPRFATRPRVPLAGWPPYSRLDPRLAAAARASARSARRLRRS